VAGGDCRFGRWRGIARAGQDVWCGHPCCDGGARRGETVIPFRGDFQHALAWLIQQRHPEVKLRLEPRPRRGVHLDILVQLPHRRVAFEVKYLVRAFSGTVAGERFDLPNQAAHDISRHDVVKDVVRLETLLAEGYADDGLAIVLTNDSAYWNPGVKTDPIDAAFRIHEGRLLAGVLTWSAAAGPGTSAKRDQPLLLAGTYPCTWRPYATVVDGNGHTAQLRYLAIPVNRPGGTPTAAASTLATIPVQQGERSAETTARAEILAAVASILNRSGGNEFELNDVLVEMNRTGSRYSESTIRTHVTSRMCVNAPDHHASTFDDFERVDRGRYRLRIKPTR
jgi:hypothetical protein